MKLFPILSSGDSHDRIRHEEGNAVRKLPGREMKEFCIKSNAYIWWYEVH
jgi:hypothetical protein